MADAEKTLPPGVIACQQILQRDASVFSIQWLDLAPEPAEGLTPELLLRRYLEHIRRFTGTLVRPMRHGASVEFRLWRSRVALLSFTAGETAATALALRIDGGLLVQPAHCRQGELIFTCEPRDAAVRIGLQLSGYRPLLLGRRQPGRFNKWLYRLTQAAIHKLVTVRFLTRLYRERAGRGACCRVVRVNLREGEAL